MCRRLEACFLPVVREWLIDHSRREVDIVVLRLGRKLKNLLAEGAPEWDQRVQVWGNRTGSYSIEEVRTQQDFQKETYYLAHCLGTKRAESFNQVHRVFSVRDSLGFPHATILLQRDGTYSPYGDSRDMYTNKTMLIGNRHYHVLQVRGREDRLSRPEFFTMAAEWYESCGGKLENPLGEIQRMLLRRGDQDVNYHYRYLLDESVNHFLYTWEDEERVARDKARGWSL